MRATAWASERREWAQISKEKTTQAKARGSRENRAEVEFSFFVGSNTVIKRMGSCCARENLHLNPNVHTV